MEIATNKFPFALTDANLELENFFETNEDVKINFLKSQTGHNFKKSDITLTLDKLEFEAFYQYLVIDIDSTKKYFYIDLDLNGIYKTFLADIVSNISVNSNGYIYDISFTIAIRL
jgi:hypothetical protein